MVGGDILQIDRQSPVTSRSDNVNSGASRSYEINLDFENHFVVYDRALDTP